MENKLLEYVKRLLEYDTPLTKDDIINELCFFINREKVKQFLEELENGNDN